MGNDRFGPVAEASTREQCIALYPGSNPGRVSSLRWPRQLRHGKPVLTEAAAAKPGTLGPPNTLKIAG